MPVTQPRGEIRFAAAAVKPFKQLGATLLPVILPPTKSITQIAVLTARWLFKNRDKSSRRRLLVGIFSINQHSGEAWFVTHVRHFLADWREFVLLIERIELAQQGSRSR